MNRPTDLDVGDFNGDGRSDLVTIAKGDNAAYVFLANVDGSFETTPNFSLSKSTPIQVAAGDFNGDGLSDVALSGSDDGDIEVFLSSGAGGFVSSTTLTPVTTIQEITGDLDLADLNRDGFLDIVSTQSDGNIDAFLGRGNGSFSSSINTSDSSITGIGALGDINGDGFADLAASDGSGKYVKLFFGTGNGGFNLALSHGVNYNPTGVALGDFNNDGVLDLVNSDETSGTGKIQLSLGQTKDGVAPLLPFSLRSQAEALQAIPILDRKIQQLAAQRGVIGAFESRLSSALRAIYSRTENAAAAASRIVDADIASESASLSRLNILREAGSAVLAQANQQPALALTLLKNR